MESTTLELSGGGKLILSLMLMLLKLLTLLLPMLTATAEDTAAKFVDVTIYDIVFWVNSGIVGVADARSNSGAIGSSNADTTNKFQCG